MGVHDPRSTIHSLSIHVKSELYSRNGIDHIESHFHGAFGMILARLRQAGDTVIAIAQYFDAQAVVIL